jgi:CRISPR-associated protein Csx14
MASKQIPVDIESPGQVFACLGFLEVAEMLLGGTDAYFDWSEAHATFVLSAAGHLNPFEVVLEFVASARIVELTHSGYVEGGAGDGDDHDDQEDSTRADDGGDEAVSADPDTVTGRVGREESRVFPCGEGDRNALPIRLDRQTRGERGTLVNSHTRVMRRNRRPSFQSGASCA